MCVYVQYRTVNYMYLTGTCVYCAGWFFAEVRWRDVMNLILPTFSRKGEGGEGEGEGRREEGRGRGEGREGAKEGKKERRKEKKGLRWGSAAAAMRMWLCTYIHVVLLCIHTCTYTPSTVL